MRTPLPDEMEQLMQSDHGICISLYLPRYRGDIRMQQDRLLFKNLLDKARLLLLDKDFSPAQAQELLNAVQDLLEDNQFWNAEANGLAVFLSPQISRHYQLRVKPEPVATVAHHFYILPLFADVEQDRSFYILTLSRKRVRLLQSSSTGIVDLHLQGLPENLEQALGYEQAEKQGGVRPLPASVGGGGRQAIFYGQGAGPDDARDELVRYFRVIDNTIHNYLKEKHSPLVIAAVGYFMPLYRQVNHYPYLEEQGIKGNPDKVGLEFLRARAGELVQARFKEAQVEALAHYRQLVGTGLTSCDPEEVLRAAFEGRVRDLYVTLQEPSWGSFDPATGSVSVQPLAEQNGEELSNLAAINTLSNGGALYFIEPKQMPHGEHMAATFRY